VFHWRLHPVRKQNFKVYPLRYASKTKTQYLTIVKLPGSFRLAAGNRHLYRYCIFTGLLVETAPKSLGLSCGPELTRQGITLNLLHPFNLMEFFMSPWSSDHIFSSKYFPLDESGVWPLRIPFQVFPADCLILKIFTFSLYHFKGITVLYLRL